MLKISWDICERSKRPCATTCVPNNDATRGGVNEAQTILIARVSTWTRYGEGSWGDSFYPQRRRVAELPIRRAVSGVLMNPRSQITAHGAEVGANVCVRRTRLEYLYGKYFCRMGRSPRRLQRSAAVHHAVPRCNLIVFTLCDYPFPSTTPKGLPGPWAWE